VELYLVRVFYQARRVLARAGFIDELGDQRMWHSISAGVRAAKAQTQVKGRAHAQISDEELTYRDQDELIALYATADDDPGGDELPEAKQSDVPRGGYQDPDLHRSQRHRPKGRDAT